MRCLKEKQWSLSGKTVNHGPNSTHMVLKKKHGLNITPKILMNCVTILLPANELSGKTEHHGLNSTHEVLR